MASVAEDDTADLDPRTFPLAKLFRDPSSFVGKEVRLGFQRGTDSHKKSYKWAWPAAVDFLAGVEKYHNQQKARASWSEPLDKWAMEHLHDLKAARLVEKKIVPEQPKTGRLTQYERYQLIPENDSADINFH